MASKICVKDSDLKPLPTLNWSVAGEKGPPILLLHGMAGNTHWWDDCLPLLSSHFRTATLDFRGHGESVWREAADYTTAGFIEDIETARQALGWPRLALGAHSLGARIGLEYARRHPDKLAALVAVDFLPEPLHNRASSFARIRKRTQPLYADEESILGHFRLQPPGTLLGADALRRLGRFCIRKNAEGYTWKFDWKAFHYRYEPVWPTLPHIRVPTLIIRGEQSEVLSVPDFKRILEQIPGSQGREIARAHHHIPLDAPKELAEEISRFALAKTG